MIQRNLLPRMRQGVPGGAQAEHVEGRHAGNDEERGRHIARARCVVGVLREKKTGEKCEREEKYSLCMQVHSKHATGMRHLVPPQ